MSRDPQAVACTTKAGEVLRIFTITGDTPVVSSHKRAY